MLGNTQRRMVAVRLSGERLLIHNAIALGAAEMLELEAWGAPSYLLVPNAFHRQDARIWQRRYPEAQLLCPVGARRKVEKVVRVDGSYEADLGDASVETFHFRGSRQREGGVLLREPEGTSLIVNDLVLNVPAMGGFLGFLLAPTGTVSVPRISRWMLASDVRELASHLRELADEPGLCRIVVGHGATIVDDPKGALRGAADRL